MTTRLIIDGNNFLFRAYYTDYSKTEGLDKDKAVLRQFFKMLKTAVERFQPTDVYFTWDKKLNPDAHNFRNDLTAYKANRTKSEKTDSIIALHTPIQEMLDAMGVTTIFPYNLEADDVIRFIVKNNQGVGAKNIVISSDHDLLQLVSANTEVVLASKNLIVNVQNFAMNVNVPQHLFILYKAIMGDKSDNIMGLPQHGPVRSEELATLLHSKEVYCEADDKEKLLTPAQWKIIETNLKLVSLEYAANMYPDELTNYEEQLKQPRAFDADKLMSLFEKYDLHQCIRTFGDYSKLFFKKKDEECDLDLLFRIKL
jgi:DNA polymerase-1